jgi:3-hydroxyacyl-[acyl-carrier-protein] dehydratase
MERIPHRYPFLLVDRVLDWRLNDYLVAIKNVSMNEPFFPGHFPRNPVMPGVLIMEALAQASALLWVQESHPDALFYFVGMENVRFKKPVVPGDQLRLETRLKRVIRGFAKFDVQALVDGEVVAEAELMCAYRANV